jgi:hypothetical protein
MKSGVGFDSDRIMSDDPPALFDAHGKRLPQAPIPPTNRFESLNKPLIAGGAPQEFVITVH